MLFLDLVVRPIAFATFHHAGVGMAFSMYVHNNGVLVFALNGNTPLEAKLEI